MNRLCVGAVWTILLGVFVLSSAEAQPFSRAGTRFTFGIIEGAEQLAGQQQASAITVQVNSEYSGTGTIESANGYSTTFDFNRFIPTVITLPDSLVQVQDMGVTKKGIVITTTAPVNLVLHDFIPEAGEATQLYPDDGLDNEYVISEWGLWNDPQDNENNNDEFLVTAVKDEEDVTITPSVATADGHAAGVPFRLELNRGECYMAKADLSSGSAATSLTGSTVRASGAVSVIVGTTCAYDPLGVQSCNELMDELTGVHQWGREFYAQPMGSAEGTVHLIVNSDSSFKAVITSASGAVTTTASIGQRLEITMSDALELTTDRPVEVQQLSRASDEAQDGLSDPSLVTLLPVTQYADTLLWDVQFLNGGTPFQHWAHLIYPTGRESEITLDAVPLSQLPATQLRGPAEPIAGSGYSALTASVQLGVHIVAAPAPVFVLAASFAQADAYSFLPGTMNSTSAVNAVGTVGGVPVFSVRIHPNPVAETLWIHTSEPAATAEVRDALGRSVKTVELLGTENALPIGSLSSGTYYLIVRAASGAREETQIVVLH